MNRRNFFKMSAAATAASTIAPNILADNAKNANSSINVALIGCGGRGSGAAVNSLNSDPNIRLIAVADLFEDKLTAAVERLKKFGENSFVDYYGPTPMSERQSNIKKFQDPNSPVRFFIGTTQTGGYGITLTAASTMIYYSNGYDLEKRQQ